MTNNVFINVSYNVFDNIFDNIFDNVFIVPDRTSEELKRRRKTINCRPTEKL